MDLQEKKGTAVFASFDPITNLSSLLRAFYFLRKQVRATVLSVCRFHYSIQSWFKKTKSPTMFRFKFESEEFTNWLLNKKSIFGTTVSSTVAITKKKRWTSPRSEWNPEDKKGKKWEANSRHSVPIASPYIGMISVRTRIAVSTVCRSEEVSIGVSFTRFVKKSIVGRSWFCGK